MYYPFGRTAFNDQFKFLIRFWGNYGAINQVLALANLTRESGGEQTTKFGRNSSKKIVEFNTPLSVTNFALVHDLPPVFPYRQIRQQRNVFIFLLGGGTLSISRADALVRHKANFPREDIPRVMFSPWERTCIDLCEGCNICLPHSDLMN